MMEYNTTFIYNADAMFQSSDDIHGIVQLNRRLSLENNREFNRFLITKIDSYEVEIPVIARRNIENIIVNAVSATGKIDIQTIVIPLYENSIPQNRRTFDSIIRQFVSTDYNSRLVKITSSKGEVYYGGKGLIFDDRYNPLMLCTLKARKVTPQGSSSFKMAYLRPVIYVSPIVFTNPIKLINKGIIKKIIPYYIDRGIYFPSIRDSLFSIGSEDFHSERKAVVVVDNLDRFFVKPIVPNPQSCTNESLNDCLVDNINDILSII